MFGRGSYFHSPTLGCIAPHIMVQRLNNFLSLPHDRRYTVTIGTDSMPNEGGPVYLVTAIVAHRPGWGGIYFWQRKLGGPYPELRHRMHAEAERSRRISQSLLEVVRPSQPVTFEIHLDVGLRGDSSAYIQEVLARIDHVGLICRIKPDATTASRVAHHHTSVPKLSPA